MDVCHTISPTDIKDKMTENNTTNDTQAEMELRKTVEEFLNNTIERVVAIVHQRERELQDTVKIFLNETTDRVVERVTLSERERELQENRLQMGLCEDKRKAELPNIAKTLSFTLPVTTAVEPETMKPIFSLQKGLASMLPLGTLMVPEAGLLKPNNSINMTPANSEEVCLPPMKDKGKKSKKFNLWKAKKTPVECDSDDKQAKQAIETKENKTQKRQKKRGKISCTIADALKLALPVPTMMVPLATDSSEYDLDKTLSGDTPLPAQSVVSDNSTTMDNANADKMLSTENIAMTEKVSGHEDKQSKLTPWKKLRQSLKILLKRGNETKVTDMVVEKVRDDDRTVVDGQKPADHVAEESVIESSDDKQSSKQKMSTRSKLKDVIRHLQCRC